MGNISTFPFSFLNFSSTSAATASASSRHREWLKKHLPSVHWDSIIIVPYGTPKSEVAREKNGYLFDDEENNRAEWGINAFDVVNMLDILGELE